MKTGAENQPGYADTGFDVERIFNNVSQRLSAYERRIEQLELSTAIGRSITDQKVGIFEAGTGIGKSLAALIPAALSRKRVVVSTATISLQDQYITKDIPLLKQVLPFEIDAVLLKGRGNYIGLRRWQEQLTEHSLDDDLVDWVHTTETGDVAELEFMPPSEMWAEINSDSDDCLRNKCPYFNKCFYFGVRRHAEMADILVVNHALLLADAASHGAVLPEYEVLIVDEAHHLNAIATETFGISLTSRGIKRLASRAIKKVNAPTKLVDDVERTAVELFRFLNDELRTPKMRVRQAIPEASNLEISLSNLNRWIKDQKFEDLLDVDMAQEKAKLKAKGLISTIEGYLECLSYMIYPHDDWVVSIERQDSAGTRMAITASPLDVSSQIRELLLEKDGLESAIFMSATLATGGPDPFQFFKQSTGIRGQVVQQKLKSPFDYQKQAILYLPKTLPEPNAPDYLDRAGDEIERLVEISEGRAFLLFTSKYALNRVYDEIANRLPYPARRQGDMPRRKLLEWFRETPHAVLFGTSSFWEGVSVDGDQLSCVIIDRIPFQVPDDPVYEARCEKLKEEGERNWFADLALPYAITRLKQGVGRLIRTQFDRGMVSILDPRLTRKFYGKKVIDCLPPMKVTHSIADVQKFFQY